MAERRGLSRHEAGAHLGAPYIAKVATPGVCPQHPASPAQGEVWRAGLTIVVVGPVEALYPQAPSRTGPGGEGVDLEGFWRMLVSWAMQWGYPGAFILSVVANATIILPVPYALAILTLGAILDPLWLGLVSGVGAAIGEMTAYALGYAWRGALTEEKKAKLEKAKRLIGDSAALTIFIFSATPLPVDVISIPVGMLGYPAWKTFLAFLAGKTVLCLTIAYFGGIFRIWLSLASEVGGVWGIIGTLTAIIALVALVLLIDWDEALRIVQEEGWKGLFTPEGARRLLGTIPHRWRKRAKKSGGGEEPVEGGG